MGGNLILNVIRAAISSLILFFLIVVALQKDEVERGLRDVRASARRTETKLEELARHVDSLGAEARRRPAVPADGGVAPPTGEARDPRTLPYWP
ncbi:MAG: hypothetical protein ACREID_02135, partial [Planctomycetota bacterium]